MGHVVGRGISEMLFGGSNQHRQVDSNDQPQPQITQQSTQQQGLNPCEVDSRTFLACLEKNNNDISPCQFYYDLLKQCQANQQQYN